MEELLNKDGNPLIAMVVRSFMRDPSRHLPQLANQNHYLYKLALLLAMK
jgi:hypothetical protein